MKMSDDDLKNFPKLAEYVRVNIPEVMNVPKIVKNLKKHSSLTTAELRHALAWGNLPLIVVKDLSNFQCSVQAANGCFVHATPDQIELDTGEAKEFETDRYGAGSDRTSDGRKVFIVGTTLLHELCHWGNFKKGVAEVKEQGIAFEVATYGRITG